MSDFVLDCSVTMAWCFAEEANEYATGVLRLLKSKTAVVPAVWPLDVANVLWVGERRKRSQTAGSVRFLELLHRLPIVVEGETDTANIGKVLSVARNTELSAYDAAYLEIAVRRRLPLATHDKALLRAARKLDVVLLSLR